MTTILGAEKSSKNAQIGESCINEKTFAQHSPWSPHLGPGWQLWCFIANPKSAPKKHICTARWGNSPCPLSIYLKKIFTTPCNVSSPDMFTILQSALEASFPTHSHIMSPHSDPHTKRGAIDTHNVVLAECCDTTLFFPQLSCP